MSNHTVWDLVVDLPSHAVSLKKKLYHSMIVGLKAVLPVFCVEKLRIA